MFKNIKQLFLNVIDRTTMNSSHTSPTAPCVIGQRGSEGVNSVIPACDKVHIDWIHQISRCGLSAPREREITKGIWGGSRCHWSNKYVLEISGRILKFTPQNKSLLENAVNLINAVMQSTQFPPIMVELLHKDIATSEASTTDPVTFWEEMLIVYIPKELTKRARSLSTLFSWSA